MACSPIKMAPGEPGASRALSRAWRDIAWLGCAIMVMGLLVTGCRGFSTSGERAARSDAQAVGDQYRWQNQKPPLPILTENSSLSNYLTFAILNQPKVESAYYDWLASVERITEARSLPDPQFTFQMDIQNIVTSVMPGLMGSIPWPDKLRVGAQVATAESQAKYFAFQSAVLESAFELKRSYYQLHFLAEKIRVNEETLQLLADLEKLARSQNEVGKVTLQDVLRAQIEQDRLHTEVANLEDSRNSISAQFKAALGMGAGDLPPPVPRHFETTSLDLTSDKLLDAALARNQRLKSMEAEVRAAEASITLARKGRLPDFSLGFMADVQQNPILYRLPGNPGTMTLPIWRDKISAQIAEAQSNKRSAEARLSSEQLALAVDLAEKSYMYRESTRNLELLEQKLLPKARQSLEVARIGYLSGQLDFFNLSDTEKTLLGFQLDEIAAREQRELALAELSLLILGQPPDGAPALVNELPQADTNKHK